MGSHSRWARPCRAWFRKAADAAQAAGTKKENVWLIASQGHCIRTSLGGAQNEEVVGQGGAGGDGAGQPGGVAVTLGRCSGRL
jgi:hypothetical protein